MKTRKTNNRKKSFSLSKKITFNLIIFVFIIAIILLLEFSLRLFHYGNDLKLFVDSKNYPGYLEINKDVNLRYFSKIINTIPGNDIFLKEKPDTCYRIFVFGGSTARAYPYQISISFSRILYAQLQDAFPNKRIEIINLAAAAINSYTYIDLLDEVLKEKPDAILLYGGHNEYYGALGAGSNENFGNSRLIKKLRLKAVHWKIFQLIQNSSRKLQYALTKDKTVKQATLMQRIVKDKDIYYQSNTYNQGLKQFERNIDEFIKKAGRKGVRIVLSELVSNIRDQAPFKALATNNFPSAFEFFEKAQKAEANNDLLKARDYYYQAKDLDLIRFRAPDDFNQILKTAAQKYTIPLTPMIEEFEKYSENGLIGNQLILDHLHPNIDGYFIMAEAFLKTFQSNNLITNNWEQIKCKPIAYYRQNWGFTELDSMIAMLNIGILKAGWPFQPEITENNFLQNYRYSGYIDSLAYMYVSGSNMFVEEEHIKLAKKYYALGDYLHAYKEYIAIIKIHPYAPDSYYDAVNCLIKADRSAQAFDLLSKAPIINKNYYYHYLSGMLKIKLNIPKGAISDLKMALSLKDPNFDEMQIISPLYFAAQIADDDSLAGILAKKYPGLETQNPKKSKIVSKNVSLENALYLASELIKEKDYHSAKNILIAANQFQSTFEGHKLLGRVYYVFKDYQNSYNELLKAYKLGKNDIEMMRYLFSFCLKYNNIEIAEDILSRFKKLNVNNEQIEKYQLLLNEKINGQP